MRKLLSLLTALLFVGSMWGTPATIYSETFGDNGGNNTAYASATCYTATTSMFTTGHQTSVASNYSGDGKVGKNSVVPSDNDGASGNSAGWYQAGKGTNTNTLFAVQNINISGYTDLSLRFNLYRTNGAAGTNYITVTYSIDGAAAQTLTYTAPTANTTWTWCSGNLSGTGNSLAITFTMHTTGGFTHRIDDITLSGEAAPVDPSVTITPTSLTWENQKQYSVPTGKTFNVSGKNLENSISLAVTGDFTISTNAISAADAMATGGVNVTVTPNTPSGTSTVNGTVTISSDDFDDEEVSLSMTITPTYAITVPTITGGTLAWDPAKPDYAAADEQFTLTATPSAGYEGGAIKILKASDDSDVTDDVLSGSTLTMPAYAIKVVVTFTEQTCTNLAAPTLGTLTKTYNSANITWTAVEHADEYIFILSEHNGEPHTPLHTSSLGTEMLNLKAYTQYDYTVMAAGDGTTYCNENNELLEGSFTTDDYPAATLTLSENGATRPWGVGLKLNSVIDLPTEVAPGNEVAGKVLVGWSADADRATAPELAKGANYTMNETAVTLYAVYATETPGTPSLTKQSSGATFSAGDNIVIVAVSGDDEYALYQETKGTSYVKNWAFDNTPATVATDAKKYVTLIAVPDETTFYLGDATNGYLYNSGSNNLAISTTDSTKWAIAWNNTNSAFTVIGNNRWLSCRTDAANDNANMYRMGGATSGSENGICYLDIYKYDAGTPSYSDYTTTGAKAPTATVDPEEVEISAAALVGGLIDVTYENVNLANVTVALFNDAACTEAFDGGWLTASLDANKDITYGAEAAVSYANVRTAYIKLTAPQTTGATDPAVVVIPVEQAYKERVFASFDELKASDLPKNENTGTQVTVSFSNVAINSISGKSVYLEIEDADDPTKYIQIYNSSNNAPAAWVQGGTLSGTALSGYWQLYKGAMELKVTLDSDWTGVTYTAPSGTAVENVETSAKAVKVLKNGLLLIEKNGKTYNAQGQVVK